jgi:hypothetical protein
METTFKRQIVTRQNILNVIRDFDERYPNPGDYDDWLKKASYIYAIRYNTRIYPPKIILSTATGISTKEFSGGEQTNRVLRQLGFVVKNK